jgi:hypothetical protein
MMIDDLLGIEIMLKIVIIAINPTNIRGISQVRLDEPDKCPCLDFILKVAIFLTFSI